MINDYPKEMLNSMPEAVSNALESKLLAFGGERTVFFWRETNAEKLLERGRLFTEPVKLRRGQKSQCHSNAAKIWEKDPSQTRIVTGYALSDDGLWRQHSWVLKKGNLIETTMIRERYFGFELDDYEALEFWLGNTRPRVIDDSTPSGVLKLIVLYGAKLRTLFEESRKPEAA